MNEREDHAVSHASPCPYQGSARARDWRRNCAGFERDEISAVAVAHVTQCPYCINGHTKTALRAGATPEELTEAVWVAAEMRAGAAYAHSTLMLTTLAEEEKKTKR